MKVLFAHVLTFFILVLFAAQVGAENIAVVLSSDANLYQEALEGFREVARHRIVSVQTLKENPAMWPDEMKKLRSRIEPDLVFVIGSSALQAVSGEITNIPVVHSMVFNPFSNTTSTRKNVVGINMMPAAGQVISLLRELNPKIRRVGTIWDPSKNILLISQVRSTFQKEGIQLVSREIRSAGEIGVALKSLAKEIDLLWLWPDEAFLTEDILQRVYLFSFDSKIPVLGLSDRHTEMGALLSLSYASARDMGRQAGEAANRLLDDSPAAVVPHIQARQLKLTVNLKTARKLDMKIPETIVQRAGNAIKAPVYRNGDWWVFKTKKIYANGKFEVEDHRVTFRNGAFQTNETSFLRGEDVALTPSFLPFATVHLADPARKWLDFPLLPGKTWSFQYRRRSFTSEDDLRPRYLGGSRVSTWVDANAEVSGYKSVVTPAGKFDAVEINRWDILHRPAYLTYLYSPQSKSVIKLEADIEFRDSETGATRFELELIAYGTEATGKSDSR